MAEFGTTTGKTTAALPVKSGPSKGSGMAPASVTPVPLPPTSSTLPTGKK